MESCDGDLLLLGHVPCWVGGECGADTSRRVASCVERIEECADGEFRIRTVFKGVGKTRAVRVAPLDKYGIRGVLRAVTVVVIVVPGGVSGSGRMIWASVEKL